MEIHMSMQDLPVDRIGGRQQTRKHFSWEITKLLWKSIAPKPAAGDSRSRRGWRREGE